MSERMMSPAEIRTWVKQASRPCPSCGAACVVRVDGPDGDRAQDLINELEDLGFTLSVDSPENVEEDLHVHGGVLDPRPGEDGTE
jgi:hypothetical protein